MAESFIATLTTQFYFRRIWASRNRAKIELSPESKTVRTVAAACLARAHHTHRLLTAIPDPDRGASRSPISPCPRNGIKTILHVSVPPG